ncbi:MAG: hypothetical protein K9K67_15600 [Bacteriovoracaceae bacterium]|nr:hypothetical protein [Bacteriovoracaceae bacterium]
MQDLHKEISKFVLSISQNELHKNLELKLKINNLLRSIEVSTLITNEEVRLRRKVLRYLSLNMLEGLSQ